MVYPSIYTAPSNDECGSAITINTYLIRSAKEKICVLLPY